MAKPSLNGANGGRNGNGRFAKGNAGGPGNPLAKHVARVRAALAAAVTDDDIRQIVRALVTKAKTGDLPSVQEVLNRLIGKPAATIDPEHFDLERERLNIERRKTALAEEREERLDWAALI